MGEPLDTEVAIETPEHIVFRTRVAGPARRALAQLVDLVVCYGALALAALLTAFAVFGVSASLSGSIEHLSSAAKALGGLLFVALFAAQWLYFVVFEAATGRTPGKAALGLRVVTTTGRPIGPHAAVIRNLLRTADFLPTGYLLGGAAMLLSRRFQRLGDLAAGTMVVVPERPRRAAVTELVPAATARELETLPAHVALDAEERAAIELFRRRRGALGEVRERELATMLAGPLGARLGVAHEDPARLLALLHDRAVATGRAERAFTEERRPAWDRLEELCRRATSRRLRKLALEDVRDLPALYRIVSADLAAAEAARHGAPLVAYLRGLAATAHGVLYGPHAGGRDERERLSFRRTWGTAFPRAVRRRWRAMALSAALFLLPLALGVTLVLREPTMAFRIVPEAMLRPLTEGYARGFGAGRDGAESAFMTGFYVYNNVGIALRCFATGIFGGLGSAFFLVQNGLSIGAILGYVASQGAGVNIVTFIVGHGSLELGAIVLAGGAGLSLGWSIVAPGALSRRRALEASARDVVVIVVGAAGMLVLAALVEGFWSASDVAREVKLATGATLFLLLAAYVTVGGRGEERAP